MPSLGGTLIYVSTRSSAMDKDKKHIDVSQVMLVAAKNAGVSRQATSQLTRQQISKWKWNRSRSNSVTHVPKKRGMGRKKIDVEGIRTALWAVLKTSCRFKADGTIVDTVQKSWRRIYRTNKRVRE